MRLLSQKVKVASSREQINILGVKDSVLMLPGNRYRMALEATTINFDLKNEAEQDAIIRAYESFLDSLPCPIQIITRSRQLDITEYINEMKRHKETVAKEEYKSQIDDYCNFLQEKVRNNRVLIKNIYIIAKYDKYESDHAAARQSLQLYCNIISEGLRRVGISTRVLKDVEFLELFYSFYNPERARSQPLRKELLDQLDSVYTAGGSND